MMPKVIFGAICAPVVALVLFLLVTRSDTTSDEEAVRNLERRVAEIEKQMAGLQHRDREPLDPGGDEEIASPSARMAVFDEGAWIAKVADLESRLEGVLRDRAEMKEERTAGSSEAMENALRREALKSLRRDAKKVPEARAAIIEMLDHPDPMIRAEALRSLRGALDDDAVSRVRDLFGDASPEVRREAIKTLAEANMNGAATPIAEMLADPDPKVRQAAAEGLGEMDARDQVHLLVQALSDPDGKVREEAVDAIRKLGDSTLLDGLGSRYAAASGEFALRIAVAMRDLGDERPFRAEVQRLSEIARSSTDEDARAEAIKFLARNAPQDAREILERAAEDASPRVRREAEKAAFRGQGKKG